MKEIYEKTELDIIQFRAEDVILSSQVDDDDDRTPFIPNQITSLEINR